jgi:hypothetical protein
MGQRGRTKATFLRLFRAGRLPIFLIICGLTLSAGTMAASQPWFLMRPGAPKLLFDSQCAPSKIAAEVVVDRFSDRSPIYLVPLDGKSGELNRKACRLTVDTLVHDGAWWLRAFPEIWVCRRLRGKATSWFDEAYPGESLATPLFVLGDEVVCRGLCEGAFTKIGSPKLDAVLPRHIPF